MFKLVFILLCLTLIGFFAKHDKLMERKKLSQVEPIALVKYEDVIYQCQSIVKTKCGTAIHCGNLTVNCTHNLVIEYIN